MPSLSSPQDKLVLVTGATGFLALWVVRTLLNAGYRVRGAVRSKEKGEKLLGYFTDFRERLEYVIVEDMAKEGAFDDAVKGVDAIEHVASPVTAQSEDPNELIIPAVHGTVGVLNSALKFGPNVKRIVVTSSGASIMRTVSETTVFTENDWADESVKIVEEQGSKASSFFKYKASKTLAEKAAWAFVEEHKSEISWDLVTLQPPLIVGPPIQEVSEPEALNSSVSIFYKAICMEQDDEFLKGSINYVHAQDIADAHVIALSKEEAGGNRFIISAGAITWQHMRTFVKSIHPEYYASGLLPLGNPAIKNELLWSYTNAKSKEILGIKYRSLEQLVNDTLEDFIARGWLKEGMFQNA